MSSKILMKNTKKVSLKIVLASDHAGFERKNELLAYLKEEAFDVEDVGALTLDKDDDYPKYMVLAAMRIVADPENTKAIIFGMSGEGEAMVANRFPGVRAAVWYGGSLDIIKLSREHNDANILSIGAHFVSKDEMIKVVKLWLSTSFSNEERHKRRIEEIDSIE
jgi:ribose 5-phosphate isomerase B